MLKPQQWNRRNFLQAGLTASALPWLPSAPLCAGEQAAVKGPQNGRVFLFLDWFHVKKGELQVSLDPERITPEGKTLLETYARDFQKHFEQGNHGFVPKDTPFGIRIVQEVAEKTEPWLVNDQPWEKRVSSPTVLFDEGRYRCWYSAALTGEPQKTTVDQGQVMEINGSALAYAESEDGHFSALRHPTAIIGPRIPSRWCDTSVTRSISRHGTAC